MFLQFTVLSWSLFGAERYRNQLDWKNARTNSGKERCVSVWIFSTDAATAQRLMATLSPYSIFFRHWENPTFPLPAAETNTAYAAVRLSSYFNTCIFFLFVFLSCNCGCHRQHIFSCLKDRKYSVEAVSV